MRQLSNSLSTEMIKSRYAGLSYQEASKKAREICAIAVESGQIFIACKHLNVLSEIMLEKMPHARIGAN